MDTMDIDLSEDNYDYNGLLGLFSLEPTFSLTDLKGAKKKVLMLHPDKSNLPHEYFLFFRKMYHKLEEIYKFTHHETSIFKLKQDIDIDTHFKDYLEKHNINPATNFELFSKEFNKIFTNVYVRDDEDGHGSWLQSDENIYDKDDLEKSKQQARQSQIVQTNPDIEGVDIHNKQQLNVFDVKESHGQPIIAIDVEKVFQDKQKFSSVHELQQYQSQEDDSHTYMSDAQNEIYLKQKEDLLNQQSKQMAYQYLQNKEKIDEKYQKYVSQYLSLED